MINQTQTPTAPAANLASSSGPTSLVPTAAAPCPQEGTESVNTAPIVAVPVPTSNDASNGNQPLTFTSGERQPVRKCEFCGAKLVIKRLKNFKPKRFCNNQCKRRHYYQLHGR